MTMAMSMVSLSLVVMVIENLAADIHCARDQGLFDHSAHTHLTMNYSHSPIFVSMTGVRLYRSDPVCTNGAAVKTTVKVFSCGQPPEQQQQHGHGQWAWAST